jgi:hypothetical protein
MFFKVNPGYAVSRNFADVLRSREGFKTLHASGTTSDGRTFEAYVVGRIPAGNRAQPVSWLEVTISGDVVVTVSDIEQLTLFLAYSGWTLAVA